MLMGEMRNPDALAALRDVLHAQTGHDVIATRVQDTIIPTIDITPRMHRKVSYIKALSSTSTGTGAVFTSSNARDTYITGLSCSAAYDATADSTSTSISVIPEGQATAINILTIRKMTTTADAQTATIELNPPLKIARNSAVSAVKAFTVGTASLAFSVWGYEVEPQ